MKRLALRRVFLKKGREIYSDKFNKLNFFQETCLNLDVHITIDVGGDIEKEVAREQEASDIF
jgi:hypothetical protein